MEKVLYALWAAPERHVELVSRLRDRAPLLRAELAHFTTQLTEQPDVSSMPHAIVSGWLGCIDHRRALTACLATLGARTFGYLVTESARGSVLAAPERTTLSWVCQPPGRGQAEFRRELAARLSVVMTQMPDARVVRDTVLRPLDAHAPALRTLITAPSACGPLLRAALSDQAVVCDARVAKLSPTAAASVRSRAL